MTAVEKTDGRGQTKDPDAQITSLISQQHAKRVAETGAERDREAMWKESVRRFHAKRTESFSWGWVDWYQNLAHTHQQLTDENQERADFLTQVLKGSAEAATMDHRRLGGWC